MEQDNSLNMSLQSLVALQAEQLNELRQLRMSSGTSGMLEGPQNVHFSPYAAYAPSYSGAQSGGFFQKTQSVVNTIFQDPVRVNGMNREYNSIQFGDRLANMGITGIGAGVNALGTFATNAFMPGLISSAVGGTIVGAGIGAFVDNSIKQAQQYQSANKYLFQNSYRFIDPSESTNSRYRMGFSDNEREQASDFVRTINSSKLLKDSEVQKMMQNFTEYDLMKNVSDLKSFKDRMSKLIDATKESALILNESYDKINEFMGQMQKMGIDSTNMGIFSSMAKTAGAYNGLSGSQVLNSTTGIVNNMIQGTYMSADQQMQNQMYMLSVLGRVKTRSENNKNIAGDYWGSLYSKFPAFMNNDATQQSAAVEQMLVNIMDVPEVQPLTAYLFDRDKNGNFTVNASRMNSLKGMSAGQLQQAYSQGMSKLSDYDWATNWLKDDNKRKSSLGQMETQDQLSAIGPLLSYLRDAGGSQLQGLDEDTLLTTLGIQSGPGRDIAMSLVKEYQNNAPKITSEYEASVLRGLTTERMNALKGTWVDRFKSDFDRLGDILGTPAVKLTQTTDEMTKELNDRMNGTYYLDYKFSDNMAISKQDMQKQVDDAKQAVKDAADAMKYFASMGVKGMDTAPTGQPIKTSWFPYGFNIFGVGSFTQGIPTYGQGGNDPTKPTTKSKLTSAQDVYSSLYDLSENGDNVTYEQIAKDLEDKVNKTQSYIKDMDKKTESIKKQYTGVVGDDMMKKFDRAMQTGYGVNDLITELNGQIQSKGYDDPTYKALQAMRDQLSDRKTNKEQYNKLVTAQKSLKTNFQGVQDYTEAGLQTLQLMGYDDDLTDFKEEFANLQTKDLQGMSVQELDELRNKERNSLQSIFEKMNGDDSSALSAKLLELKQQSLLSLAGEDKSWSKDEIEQLIDSLMERMTGKVSDDKESSESADKLSGALDDHQKVIKDFTDTVTGEISEMKESVVKLQNTSYLPSGYTGLSTGSGFGRIG